MLPPLDARLKCRMTETNLFFYSTAALVIPVLLLIVVIQLSKQPTVKPLVAICGGLSVVAEVVAISALGSEASPTWAPLLVAVGLAAGLGLVALHILTRLVYAD